MTPHFTLAELTHTDHRSLDNTPNPGELANLQRLAEFLEVVKTTLGGKPVMISDTPAVFEVPSVILAIDIGKLP